MGNTIDYYNENAKMFFDGTVSVDFKHIQDTFLELLPMGAKILDFGCGSGRDTKYFLERGCLVDAMDGSLELCKAASEYTGINVKHMLFQDLNEKEMYDGIWACASILHAKREELPGIVGRMSLAVKTNGIIYLSFKYGEFEGERNGRYFTDMTEASMAELLADFPELRVEKQWVTGDVRAGRGDERWLNVILRKQGIKEYNRMSVISNHKGEHAMQNRKSIAFICVHNSCRSQIAEALGKKYLSAFCDVFSAGTETKPQINQDAVRIMKELYNIDMEKEQYSKLLSEIPDPDVAISMGCNVSCPFIGREFDDNLGLDDPTGKSDDEFVRVIREIERKVLELKEELI